MTTKVNGLILRRAALLAQSIFLLAVCCILFVPGAYAAPCCAIEAVNFRTGIVTAKVSADGRTFDFKVTDARLLRTLRLGQPVYANFGAHQVSLDGRRACCSITRLPSFAIAPRANPRVAAPRMESEHTTQSHPSSSSASKSPPSKTSKGGLDQSELDREGANMTAAEGTTEMAIRGATAAPPAHPVVPLPGLADLRLKGVVSPASENKNNEPDPTLFLPTRHQFTFRPFHPGQHTERLKDDPDAAQILQSVAHSFGGFEMKLALLGGHKYMVADCLGIKASAGDFDLKVPDPDLRIDNTGVVMTFRVSRVEFNALRVRLRPDLGDAIHPCHFSGRIGIGGWADDVRYELHFDPILDLEQCKIGSMGQVHQIWRIGHLRLEPLPPEVGDVAKNMIEDALTYVSNFNGMDRLVAAFNGAVGFKCHQ